MKKNNKIGICFLRQKNEIHVMRKYLTTTIRVKTNFDCCSENFTIDIILCSN